MATTTSITTSYAGEFAGKYVAAALLEGKTLSANLIEQKPNIKFKEVLKRMDLGSLVQDNSCDFSDNSSVTVTERTIEPKQLMVNLELCKDSFINDWESAQMGYSSLNDNLPKTFSDFFIGQILAKVAEKTELDIWGGSDGLGSFDGFSTLLAAEADLPAAQEVAGTTVDSSNVTDELEKVVNAIPDALYGRDDLMIFVANNVFRAYKRSLGGFQANGQGAAGFDGKGANQDIDIQYFDGVKVIAVNGLAADTMIATTKDNLFFGTGLMSDHQEIKVIDMSEIDGSRNVRFIMRYSAAVQYSVPEHIVTYGITNSAN